MLLSISRMSQKSLFSLVLVNIMLLKTQIFKVYVINSVSSDLAAARYCLLSKPNCISNNI